MAVMMHYITTKHSGSLLIMHEYDSDEYMCSSYSHIH